MVEVDIVLVDGLPSKRVRYGAPPRADVIVLHVIRIIRLPSNRPILAHYPRRDSNGGLSVAVRRMTTRVVSQRRCGE